MGFGTRTVCGGDADQRKSKGRQASEREVPLPGGRAGLTEKPGKLNCPAFLGGLGPLFV